MTTNVEFMQSARNLGVKRAFLVFGAVVAAMMLTTPTQAATNVVSDALWASVDQLIRAAVAAGGGDSTSAISDVNTAEGLLNEAKAALASSGFDPVKFGKQIDAANKKLASLESKLGGMSDKSAVSKLASAAKSLQKLADYAGSPLLEEVHPKSAGFHKAGELVPMAFAIPAGCTDWHIYYTETEPGVVANFPTSPAPGGFFVTLGTTRGAADVVVTGCGLPAGGVSWLLYNYGETTGFPKNIPKGGTYEMTYSASISAITCCSDPEHCTTTPGYTITPSTYLGTFPMVNLKTFSKMLVEAFNTAMAAANPQGCAQNVYYSPFADDTFTITYTVTCFSEGCTGGTVTTQFTLQKQ